MSFDDLPPNWPDLPLDTPGLAADVADLVVGHVDRVVGCIGLVLTAADLTMGQPAVISDVDDAVRPDELRPALDQLCGMLVETGGALLFVRGATGRCGSPTPTDAGTRWPSTPATRRVPLLGAFLATPAAVRSFPEPLHAVVDDVAS